MIFIRWAVLAFAMWVTTFVPGVTVYGGVGTYLWVALLFGLINSTLGSIVKIVTFPVSLLTFGLFFFIINAAMLSLTDAWSTKFDVEGFGAAIWSALIISVITTLFRGITRKKAQR